MIQRLFPPLHRVPFLDHVPQRQIDQLQGRFPILRPVGRRSIQRSDAAPVTAFSEME
jgi:hypothetical protein